MTFVDTSAASIINMPNTLKTIETGAFWHSKIKSITIPDSIELISNQAFLQCEFLESVIMPSNIENDIGFSAFLGCTSLKNINLPNNLKKLTNSIFQSCISLESIEIPNTITDIGDTAFYHCTSLSSVTYNGTTYTDADALTTALQNNGVTVGDHVFSNTALANADTYEP